MKSDQDCVASDESLERYPTSFAQQRMWYLEKSGQNATPHFSGMLISLEGQLDFISLQDAMSSLIDRHSLLRSSYHEDENQLFQVIHRATPFKIHKHDHTGLLRSVQRKRENEILTELATSPIDLDVDSVLRACVIQSGSTSHLFFVGIHHIASDGWSMVLFSHELCEFYNAARVGRVPIIPTLSTQYFDYALWQNEQSAQELFKESAKFWTEKIGNSPELLSLTTDFPRKPLQNYQGKTITFEFGKELTQLIKEFAREMQTTPYCILLSGYQSLLYKISASEDILVGGPVSTRDDNKWNGLIGMFVNTIVYRAKFFSCTTFSELVKNNKAYLTESAAHRNYPFEKLVADLQPNRTTSFLPVIQTMFSLLSGTPIPLNFDGLQARDIPWSQPASKFDLVFSLRDERIRPIHGTLEYDSSLFTQESATRITKYLQTLLGVAIRNAKTPITCLSLLDKQQETKLISHLSGNVNKSSHRSVHSLFRDVCHQYGSNAALIFGSTYISYTELDEFANRIAQYLLAKGIQKNCYIGVAMDRSLDIIPTMLAILKCGAAYVPLDTSLPDVQLVQIINQANIDKIIVDTRENFTLLDNVAAITIAEIKNATKQEHQNPINISVDPGSAAYMMFTSGSTGIPKGVIIPHRGIVRLVVNQPLIQLNPTDSILQYAPFSFDASTYEIWGALLNGATLAIAPKEKQGLTELFDFARQTSVNKLWLTADVFELAVLENIEFFTSIEQVITGGDVVSPIAATKFIQRFGAGRLICGYGPTENTTFSCCFEVPNTIESKSPLPIGTPISGTQAYVMDEYFQLLPVGIVGELFLGGQGLALEYSNQPELTEKSFVEVDGIGRLYRTGDRVRWNDNGVLEFFGRIDHQIKIRGFRIELTGIDALISQLDNVRESITICDSSLGHKRLVTFIIFKISENFIRKEVFWNKLRAALPTYMVPDQVIELEHFPYLDNDKIDRMNLQTIAIDHATITDSTAPKTNTQSILCKIWAGVLGLDDMTDINRDFFSLGGNSLLATKLIFRIEKHFEITLPLESIFKQGTIAQFSMLIDEQRQGTILLGEQVNKFEEDPKHSDLFHKMSVYISGWEGYRQRDNSLVVQIGSLQSSQVIFWCGQDSGEFELINKSLESRYKVCGMRSPRWLKDIDAELVSILARRYVQEMIEIQPEGPFYIYGFCLGSLIATGVSRLLLSAGREISQITLIEGLHHVLAKSPPIDAPTTLIFAKDSDLNPHKKFKNPESFYRRIFTKKFHLEILPSNHEHILRNRSVTTITNLISKHLTSTENPSAKPGNLAELVLPKEGYRSQINIEVGNEHSLIAHPMQNLSVPIVITNKSDVDWNAKQLSEVYVYDKWRSDKKNIVAWGTNPKHIEISLNPQQSISMTVSITAPTRPGRYQLMFDLVMEGVSWFSEITRKFDSIQYRNQRVYCDVKEGKPPDAFNNQQYQRFLKMANRYFINGDYYNCVEACDSIVRSSNDYDIELILIYATAALKAEDSTRTKLACELGLKIEPQNRDLKLMYLQSLVVLERHSQCLPIISEFKNYSDINNKELSVLAEVCATLKLPTETSYFTSKHLIQEPRSIEVMNDSALHYCQIEDYKKALTTCNKSLQLSFNDPKTYQIKARALYFLTRFDEACEALDSAILLNPDDYDSYKWLIKCHIAKSDIQSANLVYKEAISITQSWRRLAHLLPDESDS